MVPVGSPPTGTIARAGDGTATRTPELLDRFALDCVLSPFERRERHPFASAR